MKETVKADGAWELCLPGDSLRVSGVYVNLPALPMKTLGWSILAPIKKV